MKINFENQEVHFFNKLELSLEDGDNEIMISITDTIEDNLHLLRGDLNVSSMMIDKKTLSSLIGQLLHLQSKLKK